MAEWLCSGLQLRKRRFDSDPSLQFPQYPSGAQAVRAGWAEVGINIDESGPPPIDENPRPGCAGPVVGVFRSLFGPR